MRRVIRLIKATIAEFVAADPFTQAAALSYYTLLSLAPLLLMIVSVAGLVYGEEAARGEVLARFELAIGRPGAELAQEVLANAHAQGAGWFSATISVVGVLVGATTALGQLQTALDKIWGVKPPRLAWFALLRGRAMSLLFILLLGASVVASVVASSLISALSARTVAALDGLWRLADIGLPLALMTVLFAGLFKLLPSAETRWRDLWIGAAITSLLFTLGRLLIGFYVGRAGVASAYGAAGSVIGLMVWVYYSAVIVLFGAEATHVVARQRGGEVVQRRFRGDAASGPNSPAGGPISGPITGPIIAPIIAPISSPIRAPSKAPLSDAISPSLSANTPGS
ncbi:YihY/virulence factor BrkB family protein [Nannocystis sp.]|uniref:YihY/virulence factor BrkB family protein n=1 Tax=Nannocystis sp. TaxID=1962667 RepID=UPI0025CFC854|nr:YihY/virulence factor BrkB family protein [Nannocystis sp.]MBK7828782.1 YihY/virulence factor BrkB family protein [Nannocystis sp.]